MKQLVEDVAQAKDLFSQQEGLGEATHQAWQELQATCDCCELGKDIYVDKIGKFKQAAVDVVMLAGSITTPVTNDQLKDILVAVEALCQHLSLGGPRAQCLAVHNMPFYFSERQFATWSRPRCKFAHGRQVRSLTVTAWPSP